MASQTALNPPANECRQCWFHAYASGEAHADLGPREDCPACVDHMRNGHPDHLIVR
ncbi:pRL2-8 [Streptomyces sp. 549]|uniref:pRL2-8 n=1 Tax=Streptomyces sp. 549 TaxID=3049076 RepID=UPI0024C40AD7|nr:pRL2-8 [Streptomyces sp. 549]MDK1477015.1 pRL2-8 [Streptomyces sp. 549]